MPVETEFLPVALEIRDTPPPLLARGILWVILCCCASAVVWAGIARVDIVAIAPGKIVPSERVKVIQPLEAGVVREILVRDGDVVAAGQVLVKLDSTRAGADDLAIRSQILTLRAERARLQSVLGAVTDADAPGNAALPGADGLGADQVQLQLRRAHSMVAAHEAQLAALEYERRQQAADREATEERIVQLDATIPLVSQRSASLEAMVRRDMLPRVQWLEVEQQRIEQVQQRAVLRQSLAGLDAALESLVQRTAAQRAGAEMRWLEELSDVEGRLATLEQEEVKAVQRLELQSLRAPVAGRVHRLILHTVGGVVTPAQELLQIVPADEAVEVEAWLANRDVGFVLPGQSAVIKVETFPFIRYHTLGAEVVQVSGDALPHDTMGLVYALRLRPLQSAMYINGRRIPLSPGMAVTAEVALGERRLIEFLLSPLLRYRQEALRER